MRRHNISESLQGRLGPINQIVGLIWIRAWIQYGFLQMHDYDTFWRGMHSDTEWRCRRFEFYECFLVIVVILLGLGRYLRPSSDT